MPKFLAGLLVGFFVTVLFFVFLSPHRTNSEVYMQNDTANMSGGKMYIVVGWKPDADPLLTRHLDNSDGNPPVGGAWDEVAVRRCKGREEAAAIRREILKSIQLGDK